MFKFDQRKVVRNSHCHTWCPSDQQGQGNAGNDDDDDDDDG